METGLSDTQLAVLSPGVRLVEACPGAGKTRAIVARFRGVATSSSRAVALLSFTNAAVDEVAKRCFNTPHATQPPNFIGTFDRFIHRFVVTPVLVREREKPPRYIDTWSDLPDTFNTPVRHGDVGGKGLTLAYFHADAQGGLSYPIDIPAADRAYVGMLAKAGHTPSELADFAQRKISQLTASGIYDCEQSRLKALAILRDPALKWLHDRVAQRFEEVIVDEFQDCSAIEHEILRLLESFGVRVVVVADPDQAIYEFRQAAPSSYIDYRDKLQSDQVVYLDENWRSSPAICRLASSLRSVSTRPILSKRDQTESPHADVVYVVVGTSAYARTEFDRIATDLGVITGERLVLAATRRAVIELSGRPPGAGEGKKQSSKIIRHVATLRYSRVANDRKEAISAIEGIILGTIKFSAELQRASRQEQLDAAGVEQAALRMMVARLVEASKTWTSVDAAVASIRTTVAELLAGIKLGFTPTGQRFQKAESADWKAWKRAEKSSDELIEMTGTHIHSVKGGERDAVLLDIEDEPKGSRAHVIDLWNSNETHEARRVLYVGASRARRLLVLAVAPKNLESLRGVLTDSGAMVEYLIEGN